MANIDDFKAKLTGGGARANQFKIHFAAPAIGIGPFTLDTTSFLVNAASLPGMTLGEIAVPFRGRTIYLAGDRTFDEVWTTTFLNDTDFSIRNAMEKWSNAINDLVTGKGESNPTKYQTDLTVTQLDRSGKPPEGLKSYIFRNAWPTTISAIDLTSDTADAIEEFEVTWRYQRFEASKVTVPFTLDGAAGP